MKNFKNKMFLLLVTVMSTGILSGCKKTIEKQGKISFYFNGFVILCAVGVIGFFIWKFVINKDEDDEE